MNDLSSSYNQIIFQKLNQIECPYSIPLYVSNFFITKSAQVLSDEEGFHYEIELAPNLLYNVGKKKSEFLKEELKQKYRLESWLNDKKLYLEAIFQSPVEPASTVSQKYTIPYFYEQTEKKAPSQTKKRKKPFATKEEKDSNPESYEILSPGFSGVRKTQDEFPFLIQIFIFCDPDRKRCIGRHIQFCQFSQVASFREKSNHIETALAVSYQVFYQKV